MDTSRPSTADRYHQNPVLRDREWAEAKQAPGWLTALVVAIVGVAFFFGVYGGDTYSILGWVIGIGAIIVYAAIGAQLRRRAREALRKAHGQPVAGP